MRRGWIPERTCRGCGRKGPKSELARFVVVDGRLVEDRQQGMDGRGVYCCGETTCRDRLARNRKLLRTGVNGQGLASARREGSV
jgi:predicted RNA-binding protein YlxR (DUF448 family)